jgi:hypothetical protein
MTYFDKKYLVFYISIFIVIFSILIFSSSTENFDNITDVSNNINNLERCVF